MLRQGRNACTRQAGHPDMEILLGLKSAKDGIEPCFRNQHPGFEYLYQKKAKINIVLK
jgi:hypothetical protein